LSAVVARKTLPALTSLRFAAAALIVVGHADGTFGSLGVAEAIPLDQGVSFFFVLSGFILYYNYPEFRSVNDVARFLVARVARIWPGHVFCLLLFLACLPRELWYVPYPYPTFWTLFVLDLFLIQSFIPIKNFFLSLNGVSWSISVEMFFYFMFPVLVLYKQYWKRHFCILFAIFIFMIYVIVANHLPVDSASEGLSSLGLIYTNPLVRLIEFLGGIVAARIFMASRGVRLGSFATAVEVLVVAAAVAALCFVPTLVSLPWARSPWRSVVAYWLQNEGAFPFFAALVVIAGRGEGLVTRLLSAGWLVFLGEASFSVYLLHTTLLRAWPVRLHPLTALPTWSQYGIFWAILIALAASVHLFIERPARRLMIRHLAPPRPGEG
jgi:peptidoglycan/LPS O-acetylase OafA/YrhL